MVWKKALRIHIISYFPYHLLGSSIPHSPYRCQRSARFLLRCQPQWLSWGLFGLGNLRKLTTSPVKLARRIYWTVLGFGRHARALILAFCPSPSQSRSSRTNGNIASELFYLFLGNLVKSSSLKVKYWDWTTSNFKNLTSNGIFTGDSWVIFSDFAWAFEMSLSPW